MDTLREMPAVYPHWTYFPAYAQPPAWVNSVVKAFAAKKEAIDSRAHSGVSSNQALSKLKPGFEAAGFQVESGAKKKDRIIRPVLFGENGRPIVSYHVDAYHPKHRVAIEIEAGRGAANNADYRDLVRACLMVDVDYLTIALMLEYRGGGKPAQSYETTRRRLEAVHASDRLELPLEGVLVVGY